LLALLGAHHILHVSSIRVKEHFNPLNAELNPIYCLLPLIGAHHILHVSRVRVKGILKWNLESNVAEHDLCWETYNLHTLTFYIPNCKLILL